MKTPFKLDYLRVFYEVAKAGSLSHASILLKVAQPALSRTIHLLERHLKVKLFDRHIKGLTLTLSGERLFKVLTPFMQEIERIPYTLGIDNEAAAGELRITISPLLGTLWFFDYIDGFLDNYPKIKLEVLTGQIDLNFSSTDVFIGPLPALSQNIEKRYLTTLKMGLYTSSLYAQKYGLPKTEDEFVHHRFIEQIGHDLPFKKIHLSKPDIIKVDSFDTLIKAVVKGLGIAAFFKNQWSNNCSELIEIMPDFQKSSLDMFFVCLRELRVSKKIAALGDYLQNKL